MTKTEELLKNRIDETFEDTKIEITPQLIDNTLHLCTPSCIHYDSNIKTLTTTKKPVMKTKMTKKTQLEKATHQLYDLENYGATEKTLNIDLDLYQMEDY